MVKLVTPHEPLQEVSEFVSEDSSPEVERSDAGVLASDAWVQCTPCVAAPTEEKLKDREAKWKLGQFPLIPRSANKEHGQQSNSLR